MTLGCHCQTLKRENIMSWFHRKEPKEAGMIDEIKQEVKKLSPLETEKDSYIYVQSILFKNGNQLAIEQNDIVVFVGPNNAGKSRSLRDVMDLARYNDYEGVVISKVSLHKGTLRDVVDYVCKNSKSKKKGGEIHYCGIGYEMTQEWMKIYHERERIGDLADFYLDYIGTESRLSECDPREPKDDYLKDDEPLHAVLEKSDVQLALADRFKRAFGYSLIPDGAYEKKAKLRCVKEIPELDVSVSPVIAIQKYYATLSKNPAIHEQGDGMRSFAGILMRLLYGKFSVYFIDEPESFLHPPQAKAIGRAIGEILTSKQQAFIATHSEYVLQGLIEVCPKRVKVVRVTRHENVNEISVLSNDAFDAIWKDSLLRHSNIMEGLFHNSVVICESDTDCRFYSMIDAHLKKEAKRYPEALFVHCGGKQRLKVAVRALQSLKVPVKIVADIDLINDTQPYLNELAAIVGVELDASFNSAYNKLKSSFNHNAGVSKVEVEALISEIIKNTPGDYLSSKSIDKIRSVTDKKNRIGSIKTNGKAAIPPGDATKGFEYIDKRLREKGVFLVPVGELEGFVRQVGGHGSAWLGNLMQEFPNLNDKVYNEAKAFVKDLQI